MAPIQLVSSKRMFRAIFLLFLASLSLPLSAQWQKINDVDYVWGPFKIYTLSLFSETGHYQSGQRPLMLSLTYAKPVDGRDFAISLARSWSNLGITLPDQENVVDRLRKIMPNIRSNDVLSYIALEDKGYFVLNDTIIPEEFNQDFNNAVVAVWLDPRVEIGRKLLNQDSVAYQANKSSALTAEEVKTVETSIVTVTEKAEPVANGSKETAVTDTSATETPKQAEVKEAKEAKESKAVKEEEKDKAVSPSPIAYPNPEREVLPPYDALLTELPDFS